jgi:hypothetical protein
MEGLIPERMKIMPAPRTYPQELRERAMRLVLEAREQDLELSLTAAVTRIGQRTGGNPDRCVGDASRPTSMPVGDRHDHRGRHADQGVRA